MKLKKLLLVTIVLTAAGILFFGGCQEAANESPGLSKVAICTPTAVITAPFAYNGAGEFCWETTSLGTNINSWNLEILEVNGTSYLNIYAAASSIAMVNNKYVIHYKSSVTYGHFEILGNGGGTAVTTTTLIPTDITPTPASTVGTRTAIGVTRTSTRTITATGATRTRTATTARTPTITITPTGVTPTVTRTATGTGPTPLPTCIPCIVVISGIVSNSSGQPIANASIYYMLTTLKDTTDSQGYYSFTSYALQSVGGKSCDPPLCGCDS